MILDRGIAGFARAPDVSGTGDMPPERETEYLAAWYGERTVGMSRYFAAKQANDKVDKLIRIIDPRTETVRADDAVTLADGYHYRVIQSQSLRDEDAGEDVLDVTLERIGGKYGGGD